MGNPRPRQSYTLDDANGRIRITVVIEAEKTIPQDARDHIAFALGCLTSAREAYVQHAEAEAGFAAWFGKGKQR